VIELASALPVTVFCAVVSPVTQYAFAVWGCAGAQEEAASGSGQAALHLLASLCGNWLRDQYRRTASGIVGQLLRCQPRGLGQSGYLILERPQGRKIKHFAAVQIDCLTRSFVDEYQVASSFVDRKADRNIPAHQRSTTRRPRQLEIIRALSDGFEVSPDVISLTSCDRLRDGDCRGAGYVDKARLSLSRKHYK
jgi:hypothetical protein